MGGDRSLGGTETFNEEMGRGGDRSQGVGGDRNIRKTVQQGPGRGM